MAAIPISPNLCWAKPRTLEKTSEQILLEKWWQPLSIPVFQIPGLTVLSTDADFENYKNGVYQNDLNVYKINMSHNLTVYGVKDGPSTIINFIVNKSKENKLRNSLPDITVGYGINPIICRTGRNLIMGVYPHPGFDELYQAYIRLDDTATQKDVAQFGYYDEERNYYNPKLVEMCLLDENRSGLINTHEQEEELDTDYLSVSLTIKSCNIETNFEKLQELVNFCLFD